jgi:uncharacterized protein (DUF1778 family)
MEKMPASSPKRMWALRLTEDEKQMLQECGDASNASLTDMVRWLIRQYWQKHVQKPRVQSVKAGKKK